MAKRKTVVPFHGTAEQEKALRELIAAHKQQQGALMPVLQGAQELYGYLPIEVQTIIAEELNLPLAEVYGVVTFYAQFTLNPRGRYNIGVCMGTACYVKGAGEVLERIQKRLGIEPGGTTPDGRFSLEATRCIGACGLAMLVKMSLNGLLTPRRSGLEYYNTAHSLFLNILTMTATLAVVTIGICSLLKLNDLSVRCILLYELGAAFLLNCIRRLDLSLHFCNLFTAFLYLCALDFFPAALLVSATLFF